MADNSKLVAYKLTQGLGDGMEEGKVLHLPEDKGEALCKAGMAELAKAEDMGADGEEEVEGEEEVADQPVIANSVADKLNEVVEKSVADAAAKIAASKKPETAPAQVKEKPFRSTGEYINTLIRKAWNGSASTRDMNRIAAYQQEAAEKWCNMGFQVKAPPLGINETTSAQGGYLVNPEYSKDVYAIPHGQIDLQAQCETINAQSNTYNQRYVNESSLANGSIFGGLNMTAVSEGGSFTSSLPAWNNLTFTLNKLAIFVYYTSEILEDASYPIEAELNEYVNKAFVYGINTQIVQGSTLEGLLNSPGLVTVTSSSNDTAWHTTPATNLTYADLASIWARVYPDCQTSAKGMWLFHPALADPLTQMTYTFSGSSPAWGIQYNAEEGLQGQGSGFPGTPYSIFSKPAYPCWACSAPGAAGDILYVDFDTVKLYKRPFRVEVSKEFQFGTDQVAVRYVSRLDCKTRWRNTVTGPNGTTSFSAVVTRSASGT